jgi:AraC-like DNA-binding protein
MNPLPKDGSKSHRSAEQFLELDPYLEVIPPHPSRSFRWLEHDYPSEIARWQYHPEIEIHLIRKSSGSLIAGDYIGAFEPGQVSIMGSNLPHDWMSDLQPGEVFANRDALIQFDAEWFLRVSTVIPELTGAKAFLEEIQKGIIFHGETRAKAEELLENVGKSTGLGQISNFFALIDLFMKAPDADKQYLSKSWVNDHASSEGKLAVESGVKYIFENLTKDIRMSEAARIAHMSEPTFSKYFKKASGLTFSDMVRKLRIAHACRLLDQTDQSIASIGRASGYGNLANFNRKFLAETGTTPSAYRNMDASLKPEAKLLSLGLTNPNR